MTPEQQALYQADVDAVVAQIKHRWPDARGKVRQYDPWTDEETGEVFPGEWVAEVRLGRGSHMRIAVASIDGDHCRDWVESLRDEVQYAARLVRAAR